MDICHVKVAEDETAKESELTTEKNESLKLETILSKFSECFALAYKSPKSGTWKSVTKKNDTFIPPQGGWGATKYICVNGKKIKFILTNVSFTEKDLKKYFEKFGIVELHKIDNINKIGFVVIRFITNRHLERMKQQNHPFEFAEAEQPDPEKFSKRPGTTNMGNKFEELTIASLLLNLIFDENVEDFRLSSNDVEFGNFDDIVVNIKLNNGDERKYAFQLKYNNDTRKLSKTHLTSTSGDFSIQKCFQDFTDMIEFTKSYYLILFTNLKFDVQEGELLKLDNTNIELKIVKECIPKEFGDGFCYKFHPNNPTMSDKHKMFFDKFFLFANQPNIHKVEGNIIQKFNTEFSFKNISNYLKFISQWNIKVNKKRLHKKFVKEVILLQILTLSFKSFPFVEKENAERTKLLKEAIFNFSVTVIDDTYFEEIKKMWENEAADEERVKQIVNDFYLKDLKDDDEKRAVALWVMNKSPLIVAANDTTCKVISLCRDRYFILLKNDVVPVYIENLRIFTKLTDLKSNSAVYENIIKKFYCSLQGKQVINLNDLTKQCENFENIVTTNELIQMLDGPLSIGQKETILDIYIDRSLTRFIIDYEFFDRIDKDTLVVISCQGQMNALKNRLKNLNLIDVTDYLNKELKTQMEIFDKSEEKNVYFSTDECAQDTFDVICKRNPKKKKYHHFKIVEEELLEWMYSRGEVSDIQKYKKYSSYLKETNLTSNEKAVNILTADPGMGKTELMKKLSCTYSPSFWTILIPARDWSEYLKRTDCSCETFFQYVVEKTCKTKFETDALTAMKSAKRITILWDGLDELSNTQLDSAVKLISDLVKEDFIQWTSCRKHLEDYLENTFNVLSRSVTPFDKDEQKNYIYRRFSNSNSDYDLQEVVQKIQEYVDKVQYNEMLGIPLQIFMLTELLLNNPKYLHILLNEVLPMTDIYKHFVDMKFEIFVKEKTKLNDPNFLFESMIRVFQEELFKYHQRAAVSMIVDGEFLNQLEVDANSTNLNEEIVYGMGIIIGKTDDEKWKFLHLSYAEYFVALYLYEHREKFCTSIRENIFQEKYRNVRFMFDLLLSENSPAHLAVLYNNFDYLKCCEDFGCKDEGGRNPLQIACAWGPRFPLLETVRQGDDFMINDNDDQTHIGKISSKRYYDEMLNLLVEHNDISERDSLFGLNSMEYADLSLSLKPLVIFAGKIRGFSFDGLKHFKDKFTVLYYSIRFDYHSTLNTIQDIPFLKLQSNYNNSLHLACFNNSINCIRILLRRQDYQSKIDKQDECGVTPIVAAISLGHYEVVKALIKAGAEVNIPDQSGWIPIHLGAKQGHMEIVKLLIDHKCEVNAKNKIGRVPILYASECGHYEIVQLLSESAADVNISDQMGWLPIHGAAREGHVELVKLLVDLKSDVNAKTVLGSTPILFAAENGHCDVVQCLVESGADINISYRNGWMLIHSAAFHGHIEVVKLLVDLKSEVNAKTDQGSTPILLAAENGHYGVVQRLAESGADINISNQEGWKPIHSAAFLGHTEVVKLLVDLKSEVNAKTDLGSTPILLAAENGHYDVVQCLEESGADKNISDQNGWKPIHSAAFLGHIEVVKLLVDLKSEVNAKTDEGSTPIMLAAKKCHCDVVQRLAESGADINISDQEGWKPIHSAASDGHIEVVKLLVDLKSEVNAKTNLGSTPIFLAAENGHYDVVQCLAESGADKNISGQDGWKPIHSAAFDGHIEVVKLLVDLKSEVNAKTDLGLTPILLAAAKGHCDVVQCLAESGAEINISDQDGWIPIHAAVKNGQFEVVKLLIDLGSDVNIKFKEGYSRTYLASLNDSYRIVKCLARFPAKKNIPNQHDFNPLRTYESENIKNISVCIDFEHYTDVNVLTSNSTVATEDGHIEEVQLIIDLKRDVHATYKIDHTLIHLEAQNGHYEVVGCLAELVAVEDIQSSDESVTIFVDKHECMGEVRLLIDLKRDINATCDPSSTGVYLAAEKGHYEIVNCLAESGADVNIPNSDGSIPIHAAAENGHVNVVELLIGLKSEVNAKTVGGCTPIFYAAEGGFPQVLNRLVASGADVNIPNTTGALPLHAAAANGYVEVVKLLIALDAEVNAKTLKGFTPIYLAAAENRCEVVKYLAKMGADVNIPQQDGCLPVHVAAETGHLDVVKLLVDLGSDVNARTSEGYTPIHFAAEEGHYEVVRYLADSGAIVSVANQEGSTPLHAAAGSGRVDVVNLLVNLKSDLNSRTNEGFTPICLAARNGHVEIVKCLEKSGADVHGATEDCCVRNHSVRKLLKESVSLGVRHYKVRFS